MALAIDSIVLRIYLNLIDLGRKCFPQHYVSSRALAHPYTLGSASHLGIMKKHSNDSGPNWVWLRRCGAGVCAVDFLFSSDARAILGGSRACHSVVGGPRRGSLAPGRTKRATAMADMRAGVDLLVDDSRRRISVGKSVRRKRPGSALLIFSL